MIGTVEQRSRVAVTMGRRESCSEHEWCGARSGAEHTSTSRVGWRLAEGVRRGTGRDCARTAPHLTDTRHPTNHHAPRFLLVRRPTCIRELFATTTFPPSFDSTFAGTIRTTGKGDAPKTLGYIGGLG